MTENELNQYILLRQEIKDLEVRIGKLNNQRERVEYGVVKGSSKGFPYTSQTFRVSGYNVGNLEKRNNKINQLRVIHERKLEECLDMQVEIEGFINGIQDSGVRQIFRYKYIDGLTQEEIGKRLHMDRSSVSRKVKIYLHLNNT